MFRDLLFNQVLQHTERLETPSEGQSCLETLNRTVWPSGLRRWLKAPVRKGVGSNPTAVICLKMTSRNHDLNLVCLEINVQMLFPHSLEFPG